MSAQVKETLSGISDCSTLGVMLVLPSEIRGFSDDICRKR